MGKFKIEIYCYTRLSVEIPLLICFVSFVCVCVRFFDCFTSFPSSHSLIIILQCVFVFFFQVSILLHSYANYSRLHSISRIWICNFPISLFIVRRTVLHLNIYCKNNRHYMCNLGLTFFSGEELNKHYCFRSNPAYCVKLCMYYRFTKWNNFV